MRKIKYKKGRKVQPAVLEYTGIHKDTVTELQLFVYNVDDITEFHQITDKEINDHLDFKKVNWLNVHGLNNTDIIQSIGTRFGADNFIIGAVEIKSGYGLSVEGEIKMLRVIKRLKENYPITIKATFLGAHAFPLEFKENHAGYIDLIINEMLPKIANKHLADYIDAFLETGYFSVAETIKIMEAGKKYGLPAKIHVNQFTAINGIKSCVDNDALSVDHLELVTDEDLDALHNSKTMPVALPSCSYFISIPYTPARKIIDAGLPLALATDYNPGTTPSGNMNFVVATACIKMKITPEEAINAATINGAYAMGVSETHGSITKGKRANIILTKPINSFYELPYAFGTNLIERVMIEGQFI